MKELITNVVVSIFKSLSKKGQLIIVNHLRDGKLSESLKKYVGYRDAVKYVECLKMNLNEIKKDLINNSKFVKIEIDSYDDFFHATYVIEAVEYSLSAMSQGYIPVIKINCKKGDLRNLEWEWFFKQPCETFLGLKLDEKQEYVDVKVSKSPYRLNSEYVWNYNGMDCQNWIFLFDLLISFNAEMEKYIDEDVLMNGVNVKKAIGVLLRGTDYAKLKPRKHPIQPDAEEVCIEVENNIKKMHYNEVYVASEDKSLVDVVRDKFGNIVRENTRSYYDEKFQSEGFYQVYEAQLEDNYKSSKEYFSSIAILSRCKGLVGGNCTGTILAIMMSKTYEVVKIFNKGLY